MNWYVYALQSQVDGRLYKGMTQNVKKEFNYITVVKYRQPGDTGLGF